MTNGATRKIPADPRGWFAVGVVGDVPCGRAVMRRVMGRDIVVFRTESGTVAATDVFCPHLGAHVGHGRTVVVEQLRCPFHGFRYAVDGICVSTPDGLPPASARLDLLPVRELLGVVLVYYDRDREPPKWEVQAPVHDLEEWLPFRHKVFRGRGHPHEVTGSVVDLGQLPILHGFDLEVESPLWADGPRLEARYSINAEVRLVGALRTEFHVSAYGLGFSLVELIEHRFGRQFRQLVFSTPVSDDTVEVRLAMSARKWGSTGSLYAVMMQPVARALQWLVLRRSANELRAAFEVWRQERCNQPALSTADGPVGPFREWVRQFYADAES